MKIIKILGISLTGLLVCLIAAGWLGKYWLEQDQPQMFADPILEETDSPVSADTRPLLIVYNKTNGYRHRDAIAEGTALFTRLAEEHNWQIVISENSGVFNDGNLARTAAIVFNNSTGPTANAEQQKALRNYLNNGGGLLALHAAADGSHSDWPWYQEEVIRARFTSAARFPPVQQATIVIHQPDHDITAHLKANWSITDEWYSFEFPPEQVEVLASLDEDSYQVWPFGMGEAHPIIWRHDNLGGRVLYVGPGH